MAGPGADEEGGGCLLGAVVSRREMGGGLVFLVVRELEEVPAAAQLPAPAAAGPPSAGPGVRQLLCAPEHWRGEEGSRQRAILGLLRPGTVARFAAGESGEDLLALSAEVLRVSAEPSAVARLAEALAGAQLDAPAAAEALACSEAEARELARLWESCGFSPGGGGEGQGAAELDERRGQRQAFRQAVLARCRALRGLPAAKQGRQRGPHLHRRDLEVLEAAEASYCSLRQPEELPVAEEEVCLAVEAESSEMPAGETSLALGAAHPSFNLLEPDRKSRRGPRLMRDYAHGAPARLAARRALRSPGSSRGCARWCPSWRLQKAAPAPASSRPVHLLDVGGGRGDLGICVASSFAGRCHVTVVDQNERSLAQGRARAATLGLGGMEWLCCSISELKLEELRHVDVVLGLHTCGGLADAVLGLASRLQALRLKEEEDSGKPGASRPPVSLLVCPCCFHKHAQLTPSGSWPEALGEDRREVLTRLAESDDRGVSLRAMTLINSARLDAVARAYSSEGRGADFRLLAFPAALSTRNLVLQASPVAAKGLATA